MTFRIAGLAGSISLPSKTRALVELAVAKVSTRFGAQAVVHDLTDLQPSLGQAVCIEDLEPRARLALDAILAADALVIGSPVYKGSYSGIFKHLIDLIDPAALIGKPILLTATGGGDKHALVIEHQLRPLFAFFEAATLPTGIYAGAADFRDGQPASPALLQRLDRGIEQFRPFFPHAAPIPAQTRAA